MSVYDKDYVATVFQAPALAAMGLAVRRREAQRQWATLRAEQAHQAACELADRHNEAYTRFYTEQMYRCLPRLRVEEGTTIASGPLGISRDDTAAFSNLPMCVRNDELVRALLPPQNGDTLLWTVLRDDPMSWHCAARVVQHEWFVRTGRAARADLAPFRRDPDANDNDDDHRRPMSTAPRGADATPQGRRHPRDHRSSLVASPALHPADVRKRSQVVVAQAPG